MIESLFSMNNIKTLRQQLINFDFEHNVYIRNLTTSTYLVISPGKIYFHFKVYMKTNFQIQSQFVSYGNPRKYTTYTTFMRKYLQFLYITLSYGDGFFKSYVCCRFYDMSLPAWYKKAERILLYKTVIKEFSI